MIINNYLREVSGSYLNAAHEILDFKNRSFGQNFSTTLKVISYFSLFLPIIALTIYALTSAIRFTSKLLCRNQVREIKNNNLYERILDDGNDSLVEDKDTNEKH